MSWRGEARKALREYPRVLRKLSDRRQVQMTPQYGGDVVRHETSRVTENVALQSPLTEREENILNAVEFALSVQRRYYNWSARERMVQLVYWKNTHTLQGAAMETGYNLNTIKSWNSEILMAVYAAIKKPKKE